MAVGGDQYVLRFKVSVDNTRSMKVLEREHYLGSIEPEEEDLYMLVKLTMEMDMEMVGLDDGSIHQLT